MLISDEQQQAIVRILDDKSEFIVTSPDTKKKIEEINNEILFANPLNNDAVMRFTVSRTDSECQRESSSLICQPIILLTQDIMRLDFIGDWTIEVLTISQAAILFAFLDFQSQCCEQLSENESDEDNSSILIRNGKNLALCVEKENKCFIALVISTLLNPKNRRLECLFSFIRNVESYWIAHFLLSQVMNEDKESDSHKICNASKIYGMSETYFRKLCHHVFTRGPKKQLRLWRAAHSVLQLIEQDSSIATVAGNNGYASSSHFSSEIKSLFGITPREFKKLGNLLHE